jgi:hypothetical protein
MRRRAGTGHNAASKLARKGAKPRRAPKAEHSSAPSALELQEQVGALTRELIEAREQQTATSEVLRIISSSPGQLEPVFHTILENAARVCEAKFGALFRVENDVIRIAAS